MPQAHTAADVRTWLEEYGYEVETPETTPTPDQEAPAAEPRARHRWFKLRIHVYICRKCGAGKVNSLEGRDWRTTFYLPDGTERMTGKTPPCAIGPRTGAYLGKYAEQLADAAAEAHA